MPERLSVLMPVYNERATVERAIEEVLAADLPATTELVVVDDGSTDGTAELLDGRDWGPQVTILRHPANRGKGAAVRTALAQATGRYAAIMDADLEYDPQDWTLMLDLIVARKVADVVYGSRFHGRPHRSLHFHHYLANRLISTVFSLLYNQALSDVEACYKMFTREVKDSLRITCNDFGFELQLGAQIVRARRWRIYEVGIQYYGRSYDEGKKINWKDGVKALWYLLKFRFAR